MKKMIPMEPAADNKIKPVKRRRRRRRLEVELQDGMIVYRDADHGDVIATLKFRRPSNEH